MNPDWFAQLPYRIRLEWGRRGARAAAKRGDILVVVDALCFSTNVAIAVSRGATLFPCAKGEDTPERAKSLEAEIAVHRDDVPHKGRFSLSPVTLYQATPGTRILMASPNGATCARYAADVPALFVGAFVNARAVAVTVGEWLNQYPQLAVTLLACGERWIEPDTDDGELRFAMEDFLATGAILAGLPTEIERSPEASIAEMAWHTQKSRLYTTLSTLASGVELIERGYAQDVVTAANYDTVSLTPILQSGAFVTSTPFPIRNLRNIQDR